MTCLNEFLAESARDKHYQCCSSNGHVKVNIPPGEEKLIKFHDGQYQSKVLFILYANLESR